MLYNDYKATVETLYPPALVNVPKMGGMAYDTKSGGSQMGCRESDRPILYRRRRVMPLGGKGSTEYHPEKGKHHLYTGIGGTMGTKLDRIAEISKENANMQFTSIYHLIDKKLLIQCHNELD